MVREVERKDDEDAKKLPEVLEAREKEKERGGAAAVDDAVRRIKDALAQRRPPPIEDIELAQRTLGNARVAMLLSGQDLDPEAQEPGPEREDAKAFRIAFYVRPKFTNGPSDPGQAFVCLEDGDKKQLYGFHPIVGGPAALKSGGLAGEVKVGPEQLVATKRVKEMVVTRAQLESARAQAETLRSAPPQFDFWRWNSRDFVAELASAAGVEVPKNVKDALASPESMRRPLSKKKKPTVTKGGGGDDEDKGDGSEGDGEGSASAENATGEAKAEEKASEKKGWVRGIFGGGGKGKAG